MVKLEGELLWVQQEASEHDSLLLNTRDFYLGLYIFSFVHLCNLSKSYGLSTLKVVSELFLGPKRRSVLGFFGEKRRTTNLGQFIKFYVKHLKKLISYLDFSQKNIQFQKTKHLRSSLGSEYIVDLKINYFRVFSSDDRNFVEHISFDKLLMFLSKL